MNGKIVIALLITINACYSVCGAVLRRTPKIYNALITTDENLTSSRAFPVIQPSIHEGGATHYPFGPYSPYGYYTPPIVRFGQPIVPGLGPKSPLSYPIPNNQFPPQFVPQHQPGGPQFYHGLPSPLAPPTAPGKSPQDLPPELLQASAPQPEKQKPPSEEQQPVKPPTGPASQAPGVIVAADPNNPEKPTNEKLPIPLNEFGLPPSLIPLSNYPNHFSTPSGLPPYHFHQFPPTYDAVNGYREQYLPHFGFYPGNHFPLGPGAGLNGLPPPHQSPTPPSPTPPSPTPPTTQLPSTTPTDLVDDNTDDNDIFPSTERSPYTTEPSFENIKNGSKSKDKSVPDVPPPPIPSGAKSQQS